MQRTCPKVSHNNKSSLNMFLKSGNISFIDGASLKLRARIHIHFNLNVILDQGPQQMMIYTNYVIGVRMRLLSILCFNV